jgi:ribosomal protein S27AE
MAEKKAKTAQKGSVSMVRRQCPSCGADARVTYFTGYGPKGFFWVCEKTCGYTERTRS